MERIIAQGLRGIRGQKSGFLGSKIRVFGHFLGNWSLKGASFEYAIFEKNLNLRLIMGIKYKLALFGYF